MRSLLLLTLASPVMLAAQWTPLNCGFTSSRSMASQGNDLYVAAFTSGVHKSSNDGASWSLVNSGLPMSGGNFTAQSVGSNATHLFCGTHSGIYISNNGGTTWTVANGSLPASNSNYANKFFTFGNETFAVFLASITNGGGVYRTSNNGTVWNIGHSGMSGNAVVNHITQVGTTLYASTSVGLFASTDQGLNWSTFGTANYATYSMAKSGANLVITSVFGYQYSTNNGGTWQNSTGGPSGPTDGELVGFDGALYALSGSSNACYKSMNNGMTWVASNTGFSTIDAGAQEEFHIAGTRLYCTAIFDVYYIQGINIGLSEEERPIKSIIQPTLVSTGFNIHIGPNEEGLELVLIDASGREAMHSRGLGLGDHWMDRGSLPSGTYSCRLTGKNGRSQMNIGRLVVE